MRDNLAMALPIGAMAVVFMVAVYLTSGAWTHERYVPGVTPLRDIYLLGIAEPGQSLQIATISDDQNGGYSEPVNIGGLRSIFICTVKQNVIDGDLNHRLLVVRTLLVYQISRDAGSSWTTTGGTLYTWGTGWPRVEQTDLSYSEVAQPGTLFRMKLIHTKHDPMIFMPVLVKPDLAEVAIPPNATSGLMDKVERGCSY